MRLGPGSSIRKLSALMEVWLRAEMGTARSRSSMTP
jgi:hypothetical protein